MNICIIFQIYLAMAQSHMGIPSDHMKIAEGGNYLRSECEKFESKEKKKEEKKEKKINEEKVAPK